MFSIVTGYELNPVHNPAELFDACRQAGVPESEVMLGMASRLSDRALCLICEVEKRVPKARRERVKATLDRSPPPGRILQLCSFYAAIPASFDDSLDSDYSPLDD
jgi:hypothetical protein